MPTVDIALHVRFCVPLVIVRSERHTDSTTGWLFLWSHRQLCYLFCGTRIRHTCKNVYLCSNSGNNSSWRVNEYSLVWPLSQYECVFAKCVNWLANRVAAIHFARIVKHDHKFEGKPNIITSAAHINKERKKKRFKLRIDPHTHTRGNWQCAWIDFSHTQCS